MAKRPSPNATDAIRAMRHSGRGGIAESNVR